MENRSHALATGAFVLLLGAALVFVIAWFQGEREGDLVSYTVVTRGGVPGLNLKAPVKLRGVAVGRVAGIRFDPADARQILVDIEVDRAAPLTAGTVARLGYQGITGLSFIELGDADVGTTTAAATARRQPGERIELQPSLLDQLASGGPRLMAGVNDVALRLSAVLNDANQQQFARTLGSLGEASANVAELARELRPAVAALKPLTARVEGLAGDAGQSLRRFDLVAGESLLLAQDLRQRAVAFDRLAEASDQLALTTRRLELAMVGPDRPRSEALVDALGNSARSVRQAAANVSELSSQPQSLLFGRSAPPPGPGEAGFDARGAR